MLSDDRIFFSNIDPLISNLKSSSEHLREEAAFELRHADGFRVVEALIGALSDDSSQVRAKAAASLAFMNVEFKETISDALIPLIDDKNDMVKLAVAKTLGRVNCEKAITKMIELLDHENWNIRVYAALALGQTKNEKAMVSLAQLALKDNNKRVRAAVLVALGHTGNKKVLPLIIKSGLNDLDRRVRASAVESLGFFSYTEKERFQVIEIIRKTIKSDQDNRVLGNAVLTLHRLKDFEALQFLSKLVKNEDKWHRATAAYVCGIIATTETIDYLLSMCEDVAEEVRMNVAKALGKIGHSRCIKPLLKYFEDEDELVQKEAFLSFEKIDNPKAIHSINPLLTDKNEVIRYFATKVAITIKDSSSISPLVSALFGEKNEEIKTLIHSLLSNLFLQFPEKIAGVFCQQDKKNQFQLLQSAPNFPKEIQNLLLTAGIQSTHKNVIKLAEEMKNTPPN